MTSIIPRASGPCWRGSLERSAFPSSINIFQSQSNFRVNRRGRPRARAAPVPAASRMRIASILQLATALLRPSIVPDAGCKHFPLAARRHVDLRLVITLGFKQLPNGGRLLGTRARMGVESGKRGPQIVATMINLRREGAMNVGATKADGSGVPERLPLIPAHAGIQRQKHSFSPGPGSPLSRGRAEIRSDHPLADASALADKALNEAGEDLRHLVRKRHHAS